MNIKKHLEEPVLTFLDFFCFYPQSPWMLVLYLNVRGNVLDQKIQPLFSSDSWPFPLFVFTHLNDTTTFEPVSDQAAHKQRHRITPHCQRKQRKPFPAVMHTVRKKFSQKPINTRIVSSTSNAESLFPVADFLCGCRSHSGVNHILFVRSWSSSADRSKVM